ncbi:hypothetical protein ASESINO_248 [Erwinia phage vB_EamM_Asesino]|uniref:Uncharacterized protein n=1 Tax=Erwinia phage vB_EamM_Asesino TaxID=1883370 RepID=A0A1B2IAI9_9CAUD|nr:hypothetical protein ASESINO_248 [Erwinia phage vB_EamM_Asesino]ANZ48261.1 hypothetical protein ASESINO_248 [Erwinia phage vB_EamM_Asesino]
MVIGYFFNRHGIVFVSGVAVDGRRVRTLALSEEEKEHWEDVLYPFHDKKIALAQRITYGSSPRVAFHKHSDTGQDNLVIMSGEEGRRLAEVLLQFNPPMSSGPFIYLTGHPDADTITCQAMVLL